MAIGACEECGKARSASARVCPNCGHTRPSRWGRRALYAAGAAIATIGVMAWLGSSPEAQERSTQRQAIEMCRESSITAPTLRAACADMERKFRETWGRDP